MVKNHRDEANTVGPRYQDIYRLVKRIPAGTVVSYGQIAKQLGCTARQVGYALAAAPAAQNIPWHRVINSQGKISPRQAGDSDDRQRQKLCDEGIVFDAQGRVDWQRFGWFEIQLPLPPEHWR